MFFMLNTKMFYTVVARAILSRKIYKQGQWEGKNWRKGKGKRRRAEKWGIIIIIAHTTMTTTYGGDGESKSAGTLFCSFKWRCWTLTTYSTDAYMIIIWIIIISYDIILWIWSSSSYAWLLVLCKLATLLKLKKWCAVCRLSFLWW